MHLTLRCGSSHLVVDIRRSAAGHHLVSVNGAQHVVDAEMGPGGTLRTTIDGRTYLIHLARIGNTHHVAIDGVTYVLEADTAAASGSTGIVATPLLTAPMPGKVLRVLVQVGQAVTAGEPLLILEAMKMETRIAADGDATVRRILVTEGQMVDGGSELIELEPSA